MDKIFDLFKAKQTELFKIDVKFLDCEYRGGHKNRPYYINDSDIVTGTADITSEHVPKDSPESFQCTLIGKLKIHDKKTCFISLKKDILVTDKTFRFKVDKSVCKNSYSGVECHVYYYIEIRYSNIIKKKRFYLCLNTSKPMKVKDNDALKYTNFVSIKNDMYQFILTLEKKCYNLKNDMWISGQLKCVKRNNPTVIREIRLNLIRKEILLNTKDEEKIKKRVKRFEIIDGDLEQDEYIPIRFPLKSCGDNKKKLYPGSFTIKDYIKVSFFVQLQIILVTDEKFYKNIPIKLYIL